MLRYQFYPTLLNEYRRYTTDPTTETAAVLINRINRGPITDPDLLQRFEKGISFENAVLKNQPGDFKPELVQQARELLPKRYKVQQFTQFIYRDIRFYGYVDVVGEGRVIDLKTTQSYEPLRFGNSFQNLYLYSLRDAGCRTMEYIICDFEQIYTEVYELDSYDFMPLLNEMEGFAQFVEAHKAQIKDKKILVEDAGTDLFA